MEKSRVLIIGSTGNLGYYLAKSSLESSHPTLLLVRESAYNDPIKAQKLQSLTNGGATVVKGSLQDESSLVEAVKRVDVVICSIPSKQAHDQKLLIEVIKQFGSHIKRFIPSEFGADPDRSQISGMDNGFYSRKAEIRRLIEEAESIPYTYICCNLLMSYYLPSLVQPGLTSPPRDKVTIFGTGNVKGVFVQEQDVAAFTLRVVDDPSTARRTLYLRPPGNVCSMNELASIWEGLIRRNVERCYVSEEEMLNRIKEMPYPKNMELVFIYSVFVKGDHTYFEIDPSSGFEGSELYPDVRYTTVAEYLSTLV